MIMTGSWCSIAPSLSRQARRVPAETVGLGYVECLHAWLEPSQHVPPPKQLPRTSNSTDTALFPAVGTASTDSMEEAEAAGLVHLLELRFGSCSGGSGGAWQHRGRSRGRSGQVTRARSRCAEQLERLM